MRTSIQFNRLYSNRAIEINISFSISLDVMMMSFVFSKTCNREPSVGGIETGNYVYFVVIVFYPFRSVKIYLYFFFLQCIVGAIYRWISINNIIDMNTIRVWRSFILFNHEKF